MSLTAAQVQFAAEFITLVVTAAALGLIILRPPPRVASGPDRQPAPAAALVAGGLALVGLGGAAFAHGSLLVSGQDGRWLGLGRLIAAAVLLSAFPYPAGRRIVRSRSGAMLLNAGSLVWAAAGAAEMAQAQYYAVDALLVAGAGLIAASLVTAAQRSIAVRVAASGAATLLLVVIVVALALSTVISSSVQTQEVNRLAAQARTERSAVMDTAAVADTASYVEADLAASFPAQATSPLYLYSNGTPDQKLTAAAAISGRLSQLATLDPAVGLSYADPAGTSLLVPGATAPTDGAGFAAAPGLRPRSCSGGEQGLFEIGGRMLQAASSPECDSGQALGVVLAARPIDGGYLGARRSIEPATALAVVSGNTVLASVGLSPAQATRLAAGRAGPDGSLVARAEGDQLLSVVPLDVTGARQPVVMVLSTPATTVLSTRNQLFRTLFLIAFGGTVIALGLAIFTGDRITAGLRRLTHAAARVQGGDTGVRSGVTGDDEVAALGVAFDAMVDSVTAQSAALQAAADDEARLRNRMEAVVAGMTDGLVAVDAYGRITDFNRAAAELTGVDPARAAGAPAEEVIRFRDEEGTAVGRALFRGGARPTAMIGHVQRGPVDIPVAVSSGGLRGPMGELVGTVLVFRDMRREQEVEQMKTEFLSRVGHELRTPLTGILGYADILLRRDVPADRARSWHEEILLSARRLLRIVEMLEFFATEGAGRIVLRPEPVDARALVSGITSSWAGRLPPNLTMGRRLAKGEAMVAADRRWLSLAVDELIDNAVKFSPEGGRIVIRVAGNDRSVEIAVSDQGMGMTAEQHDVIFKDFVQGDSSDTRRFGGLGLGLAVVRRVVDGHRGTIRCRSAPGKGTTFVITLPAWPDGSPLTGAQEGAAAPPQRRRLGRRPLGAPNGSRRSTTRPRAGS